MHQLNILIFTFFFCSVVQSSEVIKFNEETDTFTGSTQWRFAQLVGIDAEIQMDIIFSYEKNAFLSPEIYFVFFDDNKPDDESSTLETLVDGNLKNFLVMDLLKLLIPATVKPHVYNRAGCLLSGQNLLRYLQVVH
jgi:hypothetical protein